MYSWAFDGLPLLRLHHTEAYTAIGEVPHAGNEHSKLFLIVWFSRAVLQFTKHIEDNLVLHHDTNSGIQIGRAHV